MSTPNQHNAKRAKTDLSSELVKGLKLSELKISDITHSRILGNYAPETIQAIESCLYHELKKDYRLLQQRLVIAQRSRSSNLLNIANEDKSTPLRVSKALAAILAAMTTSPEVSSEVKDELRYYEAVCIGHSILSRPDAASLKSGMEEMAGGEDPVKYFEGLVEASERYLAAESSATKEQPEPLIEPVVVEESATEPPQTAPESGQAKSEHIGKHDAYSDEYLRDKVTDFIVSEKELADAVPWNQIGSDSTFKAGLEDSYYALQSGLPEFRHTPPGVLLHGDQGTGKTTIVKSFAADKNLTLFAVGGSIHGSLRGQSEKLIEYVFDAVREKAEQSPCVLFFDEVDGLLGASDKGGSTTFEAMIKGLWGDLINDKVPCFVFGATNNPWRIKMGDYNRRFQVKVHVSTPVDASREGIVRSAISEYWNEVDDQGIKDLATATRGYSANDIVRHVLGLALTSFRAAREAEEFVWKKRGEVDVLVPAPQGSGVVKAQDANQKDIRYAPITTAALLDVFKKGVKSKTTSKDVECKHKRWNLNPFYEP